MERRTRQLLIFLIFPLILMAAATGVAWQSMRSEFALKISFLDVGQGDSVFIETFRGNQILIDGGPSDRVIAQLGEVMPFYDRDIDLLILTHPDADHVSGLVEVLRRFKIKKILFTGANTGTAVATEFLRLAQEEQAELITAQQGQRVWLDDATVFDVMWPPPGVARSSLEINDTSIMGRLSFGQTEIFLGGDASSRIEDELLRRFDLDSDLLKVGHHGSKYSTSDAFLRTVTPEFAVVQVGEKNNYGHPTPEVLDNLREIGAQVFRTDLDGSVRFVSDGANLYKQ